MKNSCKFKSPKSGDNLLALHYKNKTSGTKQTTTTTI